MAYRNFCINDWVVILTRPWSDSSIRPYGDVVRRYGTVKKISKSGETITVEFCDLTTKKYRRNSLLPLEKIQKGDYVTYPKKEGLRIGCVVDRIPGLEAMLNIEDEMTSATTVCLCDTVEKIDDSQTKNSVDVNCIL